MKKHKHSCASHPRNACVACLAEQVADALHNPPSGPDLGSMSRAERDAHLFGIGK